MPRGIPKHKPSVNKMDGMRRALAELGNEVANKEIQSFLKSRFGIDMDLPMISNYKSSLKSAGKSAIIRKPEPVLAKTTEVGGSGITLDDIRIVKDAIDKLGADKVRQLTDVLGE
jgi:hypothetical protein